ncbi:hypothetical protein GZL_02701 [Streptomyces sp. 769]|nr:hypothetical protein GZL_02701 [Streptomyces sp. 769]
MWSGVVRNRTGRPVDTARGRDQTRGSTRCELQFTGRTPFIQKGIEPSGGSGARHVRPDPDGGSAGRRGRRRRAPVTVGGNVGTLDRVPAKAVSTARSVPVHRRERAP